MLVIVLIIFENCADSCCQSCYSEQNMDWFYCDNRLVVMRMVDDGHLHECCE